MVNFSIGEIDYLSRSGMLQSRTSSSRYITEELKFSTIITSVSSTGLVKCPENKRIMSVFRGLKRSFRQQLYNKAKIPETFELSCFNSWLRVSIFGARIKNFDYEIPQYDIIESEFKKINCEILHSVGYYNGSNDVILPIKSFALPGLDVEIIKDIINKTFEKNTRKIIVV